MSAKRINLLSVQTLNPRISDILRFLRIGTVVLGIVTMLILVGLFYKKNQVEAQYQQYLTQKESLINEFSTKRATVQKVQFVALKSKELAILLAKDPHFKTYYSQFASTLPTSTDSAMINTFAVGKDKIFKTMVVFSDVTTGYEFMNNVENKTFNDIFSTLTIDSLTLDQTNTTGHAVTVNLSGTFK